ncbi:TetR family transcriptional regulator [Pusillimonas sp. MFBS29]|uniref:TetR/AcrR family transcriptional regulator n=1 Tax=Pusillimonas sp. MFBS29 TaxID=2886690 RepID=UPI001D11430A|nr:TetR family transcriptional regulator [Pusillimonas sp. MFBS29]
MTPKDASADIQLPASPDEPRQRRSQVTRAKIIEAAERLFAHRSFTSVSMREITREANVALAAAHYHFGNKEDLFKAVFLQRARELNKERFELLHHAKLAAKGQVVPLRAVLDALLRPGVRWSFDAGGRGLFVQFLERGHLDPDSPIYDVLHHDTSHLKRFIPYLQAVLPELTLEEIYWRLHFSLGALHYTITSLSRLNSLSEGICHTESFAETLDRMIHYVEAGFRMPP